MQQQVNTELKELILEFQAARKSQSNKFPKSIWTRAISCAEKTSVNHVCKNLGIHPSYLYRKLKDSSAKPTDSARFVEAFTEPLKNLGCTISITTPKGCVKIEGASDSSLKVLLSELFAAEGSCSK